MNRSKKYNYLNYQKSTFLRNLHILSLQLILGVQISSVRFLKEIAPAVMNGFIANFGDFREVKHLLIIFSLYCFEFHIKTLIFTVFEMSNVLTKQHLREVLIFCFNWKKSAAEAHRTMLVEVMVTLLQLINPCRE